jgi:hypothetical protein
MKFIAPSRSAPLATTRRAFLQSTAALAVPMFIPASAVGRAGALPPSERITMGFIGLGGQGTGHVLGGAWTHVPGGFVARSDVQVVAVSDVRRERRENVRHRCNQAYAQRFGQPDYQGVQAYRDFREVLARSDVDAVLICVPYHWAAPMSILAMRAGKDVFCEKPVAITLHEGQVVLETSRRLGRIYQAGTQQRSEFGGKFRLACELIRNGRLGQLREVYAYCLPGALHPSAWTSERSVPVPEGLDWDLWLGPLPWRPYGGETGHALSGLFVGDVNWSPHHYDIIQWTMNPDKTAPFEAEHVNGAVRYRYADGVVVHSQAYPSEPVGGEGGACFVGTAGRIALDRSDIVSHPARILHEPLQPEDDRVYHSTSHVGNFLDCVRTRRPPICEPQTAIYTMNMILVGGVALALRRKVRWDPVQGEFEEDPAANRLRSYATRPPWRI